LQHDNAVHTNATRAPFMRETSRGALARSVACAQPANRVPSLRNETGVRAAATARRRPCWSLRMALHGNLADPSYEPTDDELQELVHSAFADVAARNQVALRAIHAKIAALRAELMLQFAAGPDTESAE
jgi:hypothetical protein